MRIIKDLALIAALLFIVSGPADSGNLNLPQLADGQNNKEVTINSATDALDVALTEVKDIDLTSANATVTTGDFRKYITFRANNNAVSRTITFPALKRLFAIYNNGSASLTVAVGSTTKSVSTATLKIFYADGTTNGLVMN